MKLASNQSDLHQRNRATILKLMQTGESLCRQDLSVLSGLTPAAVTRIVGELVSCGLINEDRNYKGGRSKNAINLTFNANAYNVIGISLKRGRLACAVFNLRGSLIYKELTEFSVAQSAEDVIGRIECFVQEILSSSDVGSKVIGLGIGVPGPLNIREGKLLNVSNFPGWSSVNLKKLLDRSIKLPVVVDHDANAAVLAEKWFGMDSICDHVTSILVGKGIGCGVITNDVVYRGLGSTGEIGHMSMDFDGQLCECGNRGCLELYASTIALLNNVKKDLSISDELTMEKMRSILDDGNTQAEQRLLSTATYLGYGCVNLINMLSPEVLVIGGEISLLGDRWMDVVLEKIREVISERVVCEIGSNVKILRSRFGDDAVLYGSAALVINKLLFNPSVEHISKNGVARESEVSIAGGALYE